MIESWRGDRGVRGVFPVLAGGGGVLELGQAEEATNWDSGRSGRIGKGKSGPIGTAGEVGPFRTGLYYPGLECFVRRDKQGRVGRAGEAAQ